MMKREKKIQRPLFQKYTYFHRHAIADATLVQNKRIMDHFVNK